MGYIKISLFSAVWAAQNKLRSAQSRWTVTHRHRDPGSLDLERSANGYWLLGEPSRDGPAVANPNFCVWFVISIVDDYSSPGDVGPMPPIIVHLPALRTIQPQSSAGGHGIALKYLGQAELALRALA